MVRGFGRVPVAVECGNCGRHADGELSESGQRCQRCGRFAEVAEGYCATHDIDENRLPSGYAGCPKCQMEQDIQAQRMHQMTRDPTLEPY